jgi:protein O-mannosyl-transferase
MANAARYRSLIVATALVAATVAAYWGVQQAEFIGLDDPVYVTGNQAVKAGLTWPSVQWAFTSFYASNWHPLTWLSHMLDVQLFGMQPAGPHIVNLILHIAGSLLLLWFLAAATGRFWAAATVAGLFALHPLHVESVAWVAERKDVLSGVFLMATLLAYLYYTRKPGVGRYVLVAALFALGLMAKPMLVTLPILLLLLDYWPLERTAPRKWWPLVLEKLPLLAMSAASSLATMQAQRGAMFPIPLEARLANAILSVGRYILQMFWPADLAVYYPYPRTVPVVAACVVLLALIAATIAAFRIGRTHRYVLVGWLWYLVTLVPVIGILQVGAQSHADRYTYLPLTGLFIIMAWTGVRMVDFSRKSVQPLAMWAVAILVAALLQTHCIVGFWHDDLSLFRRAAAVTTNNYFAYLKLGEAFCVRGEYDEGRKALTESARIQPDGITYYLLGAAAQVQGRAPEAVENYALAVKMNPAIKEAWLSAGGLLYEMGRYAESLSYLQKAAQLDPMSAAAHRSLAEALGKLGRAAESAAELDTARRLEAGAAR